MIVEFYRFARAKDSRPNRWRIQNHNQLSASYRDSIHPPWGDAHLEILFSTGEKTGDEPIIGDWVAIRRESGVTEFLGRVKKTLNGMRQSTLDGPLDTASSEVWADGWLATLNRADVHFDFTRQRNVGTLLTAKEFIDLTLSIEKALTFDSLGEVLARIWEQMDWLALPEGIVRPPEAESGGNTGYSAPLSTEVKVISGWETAKTYAPTRAYQPVPGPRVVALESAVAQGHKAADLLRGTFNPCEEMIEFFPSLEPIAGLKDEEMTDLASALGVMPVIMYRIHPWRLTPLDELAKSFIAYRRSGIDPKTGGVIERRSIDQSKLSEAKRKAFIGGDAFRVVTWRKACVKGDDTCRLKVTDLLDFSVDEDDDRRINAVGVNATYVNEPLLPWMEAVGLPIMDEDTSIEGEEDGVPRGQIELARHGMRLMQLQWPFLPPADPETNVGVDLLAYVRTVAAQAFSWYRNAHRLGNGVIEVPLRYDVRHGGFVTIEGLPRGTFTAYVESVGRKVMVDGDGAESGTTTIEFSRGAYDDSGRENPFVLVEPNKAKRPKPQAVGGRIGVYGIREPKYLKPEWITYSPIAPFPHPNPQLNEPAGETALRVVNGVPTQVPTARASAPLPRMPWRLSGTKSIVIHWAENYTESDQRADYENQWYVHLEFRQWLERYRHEIEAWQTQAGLPAGSPADSPAWMPNSAFFNLGTHSPVGIPEAAYLAVRGVLNYPKLKRELSRRTFKEPDGKTYFYADEFEIRRLYNFSGFLSNAHFCIRADGHIVQYGDVAYFAAHAGNSALNELSIGIDLMNPYRRSKETLAQVLAREARRNDGLTWGARAIENGWRIYDTNRIATLEPFLGPTPQQANALRALLAELAHQLALAPGSMPDFFGNIGLWVRPPVPSSNLMEAYRYVSGETRNIYAWAEDVVAEDVYGIMHHAQVRDQYGKRLPREDAAGLSLGEIAEHARGILAGTITPSID